MSKDNVMSKKMFLFEGPGIIIYMYKQGEKTVDPLWNLDEHPQARFGRFGVFL